MRQGSGYMKSVKGAVKYKATSTVQRPGPNGQMQTQQVSEI